MIIGMDQDSKIKEERRQKIAAVIWSAMVDDEPPPPSEMLWFNGYLDAADAVIKFFDEEKAHA